MANIYRAQIGGDLLMGSASSGMSYGTTANNAITINQKLRGLELAGASGPFKFQMETFNSKYDAKGTVQNLTTNATADHAMGVQVKADYMEFMYNITGESFAEAYKGGNFGGLKVKSIFMRDYGGVVGNGIGAWQVGYRTSKYSADRPVTASTCTTTGSCETSAGGTGSRVQNSETARTNTYALNWILNSNARIMFNYAETKFAHNIVILDAQNPSALSLNSGVTDKERVISVRSQFNF
jgi:phosphate-selective porin OprO/OprP